MSEQPHVAGVEVRHRRVPLVTGVGVHVAEAGTGPPLVLLHGWPQHWWSWRRVLPGLAPAWRAICPDLRGMGWSDAPPGDYAKETLAADLIALLDALELDRVTLIGHDWGGFAGFLACLRAPERFERFAALAIIHPWPRRRMPTPRDLGRVAYQPVLAAPVVGPRLLRSAPAFVRELIRRGSGPSMRWSGDELDAYALRLREPARAEASAALYRTFLRRELGPLMSGRYAGTRLAVPTLHLTGEHDPVIRPEQLEGLAGHADAPVERDVIAGAGHFLPEEAPEALLARLERFLG